jgi:N-acetylmuramoyl-L-alanine amidase
MSLAAAVQRQIGQVVSPVKDNGARLKSLAVCRNPAVPSCLVEVDFITSPEGEEASWNPERRRRIAAALADGFADWAAGR